MIEKSIATRYDCPVCHGKEAMVFASGDDKVSWFVCEVCKSRLITFSNINIQGEKIKIGKKEVLVDNPEVAEILKRGDKI